MAVIFGLWSKSITIIICIMQQCRWTNEEYVMIQSVWDSTNTASKHVMISTWLHIWWEEQKPTLWFGKDPDHPVSLASYKRTHDPSAAIGTDALWVRDQVNSLKNCRRTRNPHNKYWSLRADRGVTDAVAGERALSGWHRSARWGQTAKLWLHLARSISS